MRELRASSSSCRIHRLAKNCSYIQWPSKNQSKTAENTKNYMEARKTCLIFHKIKNQTITKKPKTADFKRKTAWPLFGMQ